MRLSEPVTTATDYILAVEALVFGLASLASPKTFSGASTLLWALGMLTLAASAFLGGTAHAIAGWVRPHRQQRTWLAGLICLSMASWMMLSAVILSTTVAATRLALLGLAMLLLAVQLVWLARRPTWDSATQGAAVAWLAILVLELAAFAAWRAPSAPPILLGIALAALGAWLQRRRVALHARFNHNDLFHVVLMVSLICLYHGGLELADRFR
jgi:hypothetical protein